jgi:hypothetical protein
MNDNQEHLAFNHQIGMALSQWQHVEWDLYNIGQACTGDHSTGDAYVTHFELRSFRDKLGQVNGLVLANFPNTPHLADWKSLHRRTDNAARNGRNPLAHHWVLEYPNDKPGRRWWLIPHPAIVPPGWRQKLPPGSLCVRDISAIFHRFSALKMRPRQFRPSASRPSRQVQGYGAGETATDIGQTCARNSRPSWLPVNPARIR